MISALSRTVGASALALVLSTAAPVVADTHGEDGGRLSATSGDGGFVVDAPVRHAYWASFGEWVLCDTALDAEGGSVDPIVVTGVRFGRARHRPLAVRAYLRTVTPGQVARHPRARRGAYSAFTGLLGAPPRFDQSYADPRWTARGSYSRRVAGTVIDQGCDEARSAAYADDADRTPEHLWHSLVLAVRVGARSGRVPHTFVDYTVGDTAHTLRIDWTVGGQGFLRHH